MTRVSPLAIAITLLAIALPTASWLRRPAPITPAPVAIARPSTTRAATRPGMIYVHGYTRRDGTVVRGHWRVVRKTVRKYAEC